MLITIKCHISLYCSVPFYTDYFSLFSYVAINMRENSPDKYNVILGNQPGSSTFLTCQLMLVI